MNTLIQEIICEYILIQVRTNGDTNFNLADTEFLLNYLDTTTLGDILADLKHKSKGE